MQTLLNMAFHIIQLTIIACDMASSTLSQSFEFVKPAHDGGAIWQFTESHNRVSIDSATRLDPCSTPGVMWIWFHLAYNVEHRTSDATSSSQEWAAAAETP